VVTEHSVRATPHSWERRADRLVALTSLGADQLRSRVDPGRVVHVEHGCPTWFPPRKARRGRVLGTFGFPAPYKRLDLVLDALRRVPGTELLLFAHPRDEASADALGRDAAGLPVRWHRQWLPSEEVARRLAQECDALVFWHDDVGHLSASGAARIGLATGVPVITRRTPWFADLSQVTLQADDLADAVERVLDDTDLRGDLLEAAREHCTTHSWRRVAATHLDLWQSLESA
jgi:glycosyltransferase involved in cell wall biosynthesis